MKPTLLVLAAGMGSRYGGVKQIDAMGPSGEIIIEYSVYDAIRAGFGKVIFVIREEIEADFKAIFKGKFEDKIEIDYVYQSINSPVEGLDKLPSARTKPWGTGHAILVAANKIKEPFAAINADDFYGFEAFQKMSSFLQNEVKPDLYSMVGFTISNTLSENGTVSRGVCTFDAEQKLQSVVENTGIVREKDGQIVSVHADDSKTKLAENTVVSMNFWGFHPSVFKGLQKQFIAFVQQNFDQPKAEFYIPYVVSEMMDNNETECKVMTSNQMWYGITYQDDKVNVKMAFDAMIRAGVYPENLWKK